jgi:hypothetical protein
LEIAVVFEGRKDKQLSAYFVKAIPQEKKNHEGREAMEQSRNPENQGNAGKDDEKAPKHDHLLCDTT